MVLGLESIPFMKLTASVHSAVVRRLQKSQKPAGVVSKIGEIWDMPARFFRLWRAVDDFSPPREYIAASRPHRDHGWREITCSSVGPRSIEVFYLSYG